MDYLQQLYVKHNIKIYEQLNIKMKNITGKKNFSLSEKSCLLCLDSQTCLYLRITYGTEKNKNKNKI